MMGAMGGMGGPPPGPGMNGGPPPGAFPSEAPLPGMGVPAELMPAPMQPFAGQPGQMDQAALAAYLQSLPQQNGGYYMADGRGTRPRLERQRRQPGRR